MRNRLRGLALVAVVVGLAVVYGGTVGAAVSIERAEVSGGRLRVEGTASPNRDITIDGVVMGRSDSAGRFRVEREPYAPPADCTVDVNDGSATARPATLSGCTVVATTSAPTTTAAAPTTTTTTSASTSTTLAPTTTAPASTTTTAPTGFRIITTSPLPGANVGTEYTAFIEACCGNGTPYRWKLVAGSVPSGLRFAGDDFRLSRTTGVVGTPTRTETTTFTVEARDGSGATTRKAFSITVNPPLPLEITNQGNVLAPGTVGQGYATNLFAIGGVRPWTWSIVGALPPGLGLAGNQISGTPTTAGSYTFTARVRSADGQQAERTFTIEVRPPA